MPRTDHSPALALHPARFQALWDRLGLRGSATDTFQALLQAYREPGRIYHTDSHIADCLVQLDLEPGIAHQPDLVEMALWFHDVVYDIHADTNEARSAVWAAETLAVGGAGFDVTSQVSALILATRHLAPARDHDAQVITDIDLSILGRTPEAFATFERQIRAEYASVPDAIYRAGRCTVLARFLEWTPLYQTPAYRHRFEQAAGHNLQHALVQLTS